MKLQGIVKKHKAVNEYLRITGGRLSANFTHQYLPLFYSGSADTVMQNIVIALLSSLIQHLASLSLIKTVGVSLPVVNALVAMQRLRAGRYINRKEIFTRVKHSAVLLQAWAEQVLVKVKGNRPSAFPEKFDYSTPLNRFGYKGEHNPPAASA